MIGSYTGTLAGQTQDQLSGLRDQFIKWDISALHFGDAIGGDEQACRLAQVMWIDTWSHPCDIEAKRAFTTGHAGVFPVLPPPVRNRHIVLAGGVLFATPRHYHEILRSGTWATIRFAQRQCYLQGKIVIIYPDGKVEIR